METDIAEFNAFAPSGRVNIIFLQTQGVALGCKQFTLSGCNCKMAYSLA
jgi:hypothetical protein